MKKRLATILALAFVLFAVIGCTPHIHENIIDPNALVIMGKSTDMAKPYMQKIFERYKSETGKSLNIIAIEDTDFETTAAQAFADGKGPDVFFHFHNDDLNRLNVADNFLYMNEQSWVGELTDSAKNYCTDDEGNLLGLPFWESSVSGCYYNKKLLGNLVAHTQASFDTLCRTIMRRGITPICWPANGCTWMYQFGLDPVFADDPELLGKLNSGEVDYKDIPAVKSMVEWLNNAKNNGWFGSNYNEIGWDRISGELNSGNAAMIFIWDTWFYTDFVEGTYKKEDFALMPVFMGTASGGTYEGGNLNMMMANKNSQKLDEALDFISFCATADHYNYAFDGISTVSVFKGQTTNIQSHMVTESETAASIAEKERVSTASTKIAGYSADDVASAFGKLFSGEVDVDGCITLLDDLRKSRK